MIVEGKQLASKIQQDLKAKVSAHKDTLRLAIVSVGKNKAIEQFIRIKRTYGESIGVQVALHAFPVDITEAELLESIKKLAREQDTTGIIVQLPLPSHINTEQILENIPYEKDVDVLAKTTIERFIKGETKLIPPVAGAVQHIFDEYRVNIGDKKIVIIGSGRLVGAPIADLLKRNNAAYVIVDEHTPNREEIIFSADIIISGVGKANLVTPEIVKEGVILIDAGTGEAGGSLVGDIDPECENKSALFTPVPGGVGPLTVAVLFENLVNLAYASDK